MLWRCPTARQDNDRLWLGLSGGGSAKPAPKVDQVRIRKLGNREDPALGQACRTTTLVPFQSGNDQCHSDRRDPDYIGVGWGRSTHPQIPRRCASRNDTCLHVTNCHNHLKVVLGFRIVSKSLTGRGRRSTPGKFKDRYQQAYSAISYNTGGYNTGEAGRKLGQYE